MAKAVSDEGKNEAHEERPLRPPPTIKEHFRVCEIQASHWRREGCV